MKRSLSLLLIMGLLIAGFAYLGSVMNTTISEDSIDLNIVVASEFGDGSFYDSARDGGEALKKEGVNVSYTECKDQGFRQNMINAADNSDIIVLVGWEFWELDEIALDYPDKYFIWIDNALESPEDYPNVLNVLYEQNEGSYLAGYIAAAMSQTGTIGAVLGVDDATGQDFIAGYTQGAKQANSQTRVIVNNAEGDYENPALGKTLAEELNSQGADVIFQIAGNTGKGVFEAAQEKGFFAIGVDKDQKKELPEYDEVILCSVVKEVGLSIHNLIKDYADKGVFRGGRVINVGMDKGYVGISYGSIISKQLVSDDLKNQVEKLQKRIVSGEIKVDSAE